MIIQEDNLFQRNRSNTRVKKSFFHVEFTHNEIQKPVINTLKILRIKTQRKLDKTIFKFQN